MRLPTAKMTPTAPMPNPPSQLAKFPPEVVAAYARYQATGDVQAVHLVVLAILKDYAPRGEATAGFSLDDSQRLIEDLGFDSLAVAETVFCIEDLFDVKITNEDLVGMHTLGELRAFVVSKLAGKSTSA